MKLLNQNTQTVKIVETTVQDEGRVYLVKDYYDQSDKVIDTTVQTAEGYIVEDPAVVEQVLEFIDSL